MSVSPRSSGSPVRPPPSAARSLMVLRRAGLKLWLFTIAAGAHALAGHGFAEALTTLALMTAILDLGLGHWNAERVTATHFTYFDEAVWFLILAHLLRHVL